MSLERVLSEDGKQLSIMLDEKFDFSQVQSFRIAYSTDSEQVNCIIIDLKRTQYMDSSALGMLLNMQKAMSSQVTNFRIINSNEQVAKILRIARFDKKFSLS